MAFKRYIYKHGKKLGPYYYENVRSFDGSVKTVYLGTNPSHHPRHRIRKPLVFLIIALVLILVLGSLLFFLQNKAYLIKKTRFVEPDFDVDQILLKVLIRSGEFLEKQLRVMNTGSEQSGIDVVVFGLDMVKIDEGSFILKPGQTKVVTLNFLSFMPEQKIQQQPGVYVGKLVVKSYKALKEIPVIVEIESKNVLFDMNLNPVAIERKVKQGADTTIEVRLFNLESIESENVDVEYFAKDMSGNTILTESETVVVKTQASFFKTISIPKNLKPGPYVFAAQAKFGNSIGTSSYLFEVTGPEVEASFAQFCKNSILCLGLSLTTMLLLFALTAYFYFFIGAYLYEKVTGIVTLPKKKEEESEAAEEVVERLNIFDKIRNRIDEWKKERELKKAEKEGLEKEEELQRLAEERKAQLEAKRKKIVEDKRKQEELRKQEKLRREAELEKQKELEAKQKIEEKQKKKLEREKLWKERKKNVIDFFHKIGLYKTPEEKKRIAIEKEKESQEKLRREVELEKQRVEKEKLRKDEESRKQKEIEESRKAEERIKALEEKRKAEEERQRQKELEKQRILEDRRKLVEERQSALEERTRLEEERRKELERQEQANAKKLGLVKQLDAKLSRNKEIAGQLNSEIKRLESEKIALSGNISEADSRIRHISNEIFSEAKGNEELSRQRHSLFERYRKQIEDIGKEEETQKTSIDSMIKELKAKLESKKAALARQLETELRELSPSKRKGVERWKRLELKAKLKIEEQNFEDELKKLKSGKSGRRSEAESNYKKSVAGISKRQRELKETIAGLELQKQQALLQKQSQLKNLDGKGKKIQKIRQNLEGIVKEQEQIKLELSKLKPGLNIKGFFGDLASSYRKKTFEEEAQKLEEKRKLEEQRKIDEGMKAREEIENKQKELVKQRAKEEKRKLEEERQRQIEEKKEEKPIIEAAEEKKPEKKKWFAGLFKREKPEPEFKGAEESAEEPPIAEKKPAVFGKMLKEAGRKEEKPAEQKKPKSEVEELEEAIRSLGLFRKIETGKIKPTERLPEEKPSLLKRILRKREKEVPAEEIGQEKPAEATESIFKRLFSKKDEVKKPAEEEKEALEEPALVGKSRQFEKFHDVLDDAKEAVAGNNIPKAKKIYVKARELYISLEDGEKKEVYGELMYLYNKLK